MHQGPCLTFSHFLFVTAAASLMHKLHEPYAVSSFLSTLDIHNYTSVSNWFRDLTNVYRSQELYLLILLKRFWVPFHIAYLFYTCDYLSLSNCFISKCVVDRRSFICLYCGKDVKNMLLLFARHLAARFKHLIITFDIDDNYIPRSIDLDLYWFLC